MGAGVKSETEYQFLMNFYYMGEDVPRGIKIGNAVAVTFSANDTPAEMATKIAARVLEYQGEQVDWDFPLAVTDIVMPAYTTGTS